MKEFKYTKLCWLTLLLIMVVGCQTDEAVPLVQAPQTTRLVVSAQDIPEVTTILLQKMGARDGLSQFTVNDGESTSPFDINWDRIKQLVDSTGRETYTFGLSVADGNPATFYNLILRYSENAEAHQPFILKYTMAEDFLPEYRSTRSLENFRGSVQKIRISESTAGGNMRGNALLGPGDVALGEPCPGEQPVDSNSPGGGGGGGGNEPDPTGSGGSYECVTYIVTTTWYSQTCSASGCDEPVAIAQEQSTVTECGWSNGSDVAGADDDCDPEEGEIPILEPEIPCDTGDEILDDDNIQTAMESLWESSNTAAAITERREKGGWIIRNDQGNLSFQQVNWQSTPCGLIPPQNYLDLIPDNVVGFIHTHPFFLGENTVGVCGGDGSTSYTSGTNIWDIGFLADVANRTNNYFLQGYVLDGTNIVRFSPLGAITEISRCGY